MSVDNERRIAGGRRIPIKTIVEIGAGEGGSAAFEAESVDVTTSGMHLRTAYLPEIGEPLVCRFEGNGKEVIVQGEVAWRKEEACGGDFGVRFSEIDGESLAVLREIVGEEVNTDAQSAAQDCDVADGQVQRGTRVRLHIEGLASPMKARVRDTSPSEVMVGSNLEFLKVGRPLELENVDAKTKRSARIERVNIEVDPSSRIPQLVVALRYLGIMGHETASSKSRGPADSVGPASEQDCSRAQDVDFEDGVAGKGAVLWSKVKQVGPTLINLGGKAKNVVNGAVERAAAYKEKRAAKSVEEPPRRTTAPAPSGGLKSGGRKVVRDDTDKEVEQWTTSERRKTQKRAAIGAAAALLLVTIVFAAARKPPPVATSDASVATADGARAATADQAAPAVDPGAAVLQPAVVANVPLYGATPLSTTEPVPAPPASAIAAANQALAPAVANPPPVDTITGTVPGAPLGAIGSLAAVGPAESANDGADDTSDDDSDSKSGSSSGDKSSAPGTKHFARGKLHNPIVMGLRMVGSIKSVHGAPTATGFVVHVKGTHSKEPAAALRKRDPRIASIKVVNTDSGSDLSVQFRDGVPSYAVRAKGATLEIALGRGDSKVAKAGKAEPRKSPSKDKTKHKSSSRKSD